MKSLTLFFIVILLASCHGKQSDFNKLKSSYDSLTLQLAKKEKELSGVVIQNSMVKELTSKYTNEAYDIYVSYPADYKKSGKKYPLLVVLDAEVNFGAVTYIARRLIKDKLIPELLIVGIAYRGETDEENYYAIRGRDLTPTADPDRQYKFGTGGAENFVKFISLELFPHLTNNFPINPDDKSIYGHSFGGLFGFHVLLNHPTLFNNYLLLSPSLWWNQRNIMKGVKLSSSVSPGKLKLYAGTGSKEGGGDFNMVKDHLEIVGILSRDDKKIKIKSEILDNETHRTVFGRGFTNGLRFLYAKD